MLSTRISSGRKRRINIDLTSVGPETGDGFRPGDVVYVRSTARFMRFVMLHGGVVILTDDDDTVLVTGIENVVTCAPAIEVTEALAAALESLPLSITEGMHPDVRWIRDRTFKDLCHSDDLYVEVPRAGCSITVTCGADFLNPKVELHRDSTSEGTDGNRQVLTSMVNLINERMKRS